MSKLLRISEYRRPAERVVFERGELNKILALYADRVSRGEWRDYAIDHRPNMAAFTVFRSCYEWPLFVITHPRSVAWTYTSSRDVTFKPRGRPWSVSRSRWGSCGRKCPEVGGGGRGSRSRRRSRGAVARWLPALAVKNVPLHQAKRDSMAAPTRGPTLPMEPPSGALRRART